MRQDVAPLRRKTRGSDLGVIVSVKAMMLSLGRMFESDHRDGTLEHLALSPAGLPGLVAAKILVHLAQLIGVAVAEVQEMHQVYLAEQAELAAQALLSFVTPQHRQQTHQMLLLAMP